jgi:two-component system KDP operon response regulator KdpE
MKPLILVIEDDPQIRRFLRATLAAEDYQFHEAVTAAEGIAQAASRQPDLVLLDLGLPDRDGLDVIREIRSWSQMPIVVLSARGQEKDKIAALDLGADDYVAKPFAVGELLARIRAALRRAAPFAPDGADPIVRFGNVQADFEKRLITVGGQEVHLTPNEYKLLQVLIKHAGRVVTQRQLLNEVWGPQHTEQSQYLRVYVAQLRRKLEQDPARPRYLQTEPGVGYRLSFDRSSYALKSLPSYVE